MEKIYDILILGGGVAGMSAAVYAKRAGKNVAIVEKQSLGGQILLLDKIENFPSQTQIDGMSLAKMFSSQIKALDIEILRDEILSVDFNDKNKLLNGRKNRYLAKNVIIATGIKNRELEIGENALLGNGVSYCAVCDGSFFKGQEVCVASKGGSGIKDALYLCDIASKVIVLDSQDLSKFAAVNKKTNLEVVSNCRIESIEKSLDGIVLKINNMDDLSTKALFVELGKIPATKLFENVLKLDSSGYIITNEKMQTSVEGVFAVGDVRNGILKQIVTACNDGAIAAMQCL